MIKQVWPGLPQTYNMKSSATVFNNCQIISNIAETLPILDVCGNPNYFSDYKS